MHPKNSNHLRSHLRAIMALDHSRLGLENEWGQFFAIGKFTLQNFANKSGGMQTSLLYFLYITSDLKQYYEVLILSYSTLDRMQYFTILQDKLHSFNIQDDWSTCGLLAKPFTKKISKITYCGQPLLFFDKRQICSASCQVFEWTLTELPFNIIKNLT